MGAPFAFACRQEELKALHLPHSDEDVVASFLSLILPSKQEVPSEALLLRYLRQAQMCVLLGDALFVHGGLNDRYLG